MNRRSLLKKSAVVTGVALAGCFGLAATAPDEESDDDSAQADTKAATQKASDSTQSNGGGSGSQSSESTSKSTSGPSGSVNDHDSVEVLEATYSFEDFVGPKVSGKVENVGDSDLMSATITVKYFDSGETRLGESMDMINDFAAGGTATFETVGGFDVEEGDIASWELSVDVTDL